MDAIIGRVEQIVIHLMNLPYISEQHRVQQLQQHLPLFSRMLLILDSVISSEFRSYFLRQTVQDRIYY